MEDIKWIFCPICNNKTRLWIHKDTILENFPLFCPKCRQETLRQLNISIIREPDAKARSR